MQKLYKKFNNYVLVVGNEQYKIDNIEDIPEEFGTEKFKVKLTLTNQDELSNGDIKSRCYVAFDEPYQPRLPYSNKMGSSLILDVTQTLSGDGSGGLLTADSLLLQGEVSSAPYLVNIDKDYRIGITMSYLVGVGNEAARRFIGTTALITTIGAMPIGTSSLFHFLRQEDWSAYADPITGKTVIRRGSLDFREFPMKEMVVLGKENKKENVGNTDNITLDENEEWLRRIQFNVNSTSDIISIMFGIGNKNNIYGNYVSGDGKVVLNSLKKQGVNEKDGTTYKGDGLFVSPVYAYAHENSNVVDIAVETDKNVIPLNFNEKDEDFDGQSLNNVKLDYVKDNQTIESDGLFDIVRLTHGETVLLYNKHLDMEFKINGTSYNDRGNSLWTNKNAIMIAGTYDDNFIWSRPLVNRIDNDSLNVYPMMIMNGCNYMSSIYNKINNTLSVFALCSDGNNYLGCYTVDILSLRSKKNKNIKLCEAVQRENTDFRDFLWRVPNLPDNFINDEHKFWAKDDSVIDISYSVEEEELPQDKFIRVLGPRTTYSQVAYNGAFYHISSHVIPNGTYVVLYDSPVGIKAVFSNDSGGTWRGSNLIYARDAYGGVIINGYLFFIDELGIGYKETFLYDFNQGEVIALEGNGANPAEIEEQERLDDLKTTYIGSGPINPQRVSGYVTASGITKVFFYDNNNVLKCIEASDEKVWKVSNNF